jgi:hypothetical protein
MTDADHRGPEAVALAIKGIDEGLAREIVIQQGKDPSAIIRTSSKSRFGILVMHLTVDVLSTTAWTQFSSRGFITRALALRPQDSPTPLGQCRVNVRSRLPTVFLPCYSAMLMPVRDTRALTADLSTKRR